MKLGLALSGGGFRASFFHIGVLARMAEIGKLRKVSVISTVSGGSIIGAMYYIKLKKLFESGDSPTNAQLVGLVQELELEFLAGVQKNIRLRAFCNPLKCLRMSMANYSVSDRLAELYDEVFYRPVLNPDSKEMIKMRDLAISPVSHNKSFCSDACELPIIMINSTSLNSGRNWRFEVSSMGEPVEPPKNFCITDSNLHFSRPVKYDEMPEKPRNIKLGHAVAASACVPGLFNPLAISDLYKDIRIQLVDGGVHDNQGTEALLDRGCNEIIISDASGHLDGKKTPSSHVFFVLTRSNKILMDRVRNEELREVLTDKGIKSTFLYLRKGIAKKTISCIHELTGSEKVSNDRSLDFHVHPDIQNSLSNIRTDLDSFTDIEADALMADGYLMSQHNFKEKQVLDHGHWRFSHLFDAMQNNHSMLNKHLKTASKQFFKAFYLQPMLAVPLALLFISMFFMIVYHLFGENIRAFMHEPLEMKTNLDLFSYIFSFIALGLVSLWLMRWRDLYTLYEVIRKPFTFVGRLLFRAIPPALGAIFIWIYWKVFGQIFLKAGKREKFR